MSGCISILNGLAVTLFGGILSASFCNVLTNRRNWRIFCVSMVVLPLVQGIIYFLLDANYLRQIYPLVVHLPLMLILFKLSGKFFWAGASILAAYLCCQLRRWFALLVVTILSGGIMMQEVLELIITVPLLLLLLHFVSPAIQQVAEQSLKTQVHFGIVPALYYGFDYVTRIYSKLLASGNQAALEFMPFVCCVTYLIFLLYRAAEEYKRGQLEQMQRILNLQLDQSVRVIASLRESQELARQYRHDLRHHLQYLSSCLENGKIDGAKHYISDICKEIEAQKVERYCENEAANLILSSFVGRAKKEGITIKVQGNFPQFSVVSDQDLCVLLSNALENALHACQPFAARGEVCTIDVRFRDHMGKTLLQVTNPCGEDVRFENGVPVTERPGHGVGVQSICAIVQRYGGVYSFSVENGRFILRLSL